jgi:hypothetical protein
VVEYLGRFYKIIVATENYKSDTQNVTFDYKDYQSTGEDEH